MKEKPSGSAKLDILVLALQSGQFEKTTGNSYSYDGCELCEKKFRTEHEVVLLYPKSVKIDGLDMPFDITTESGKLCLPCLIDLHKVLPSGDKSLQSIVEYAQARIERDQAQIYVPQAIADEESKTPKKG